MSRRNLFILLTVFLVLVVLAAFQAQQRLTPGTSDATPSGSFLGKDLNLTVLDIKAIRLRDPNTDATFVISRDGNGNWTAPLNEGSLDQDTASNIARTVVLASYQQTIPVLEATELAQYGFRPHGSFAVDIIRTNNEGHVLAIGGIVPSGTAYYMLLDDQPTVFFIDRGAVEYLMAYLVRPPLT